MRLLAILAVSFGAEAPSDARRCLTESFHFLQDTNRESIEQRFALYDELGADIVRITAFPKLAGISEAYIEALKASDLRIKLILANMPQGPEWELTNEHGRKSRSAISYWHPELRKTAEAMTQSILAEVRAAGLMDRVDYVIPALGVAGEPLYPHPWTTGHDEPSFWCYGEYARADFRRAMRAKYETLDAANTRWGTRFATWDAVAPPRPGEHPGPYWADVLTWYRDAKRDYVRWAVEMTGRYTDKLLLIYVPGLRITRAMWDEAVETGRGNVWVTIMTDTDWLIELAAGQDAWLQYTGFGEGSDGLYVAEYVQGHGHTGVGMWAENPGMPGAVRQPARLCRLAERLGYFGFDLTFSGFILEENGVRPNELFPKMKEGFAVFAAGDGGAGDD